MQLRAMSAAVLASAVLTTGCGGSSHAGSPATSPSTASAAASASSTAASTAGTPASASSFTGTGNCRQLAGLGLTFERAIAAARGGPNDFGPSVRAFQDLANGAPEAIRPDLQVVAPAFASYVAALSKLGLKPNTPPTATQLSSVYAALQAFAAPPVRAAVARIRTWVHQNCTPTS